MDKRLIADMEDLEINKIYCMESLEFLKKLPDKLVDLMITDPPYGIKADKGRQGGDIGILDSRSYEDAWDNKTPEKNIFDEILRVSKKTIIFGGNFFTDKLPIGNHWIVWDKKGSVIFKNHFSDCELAWTNIEKKSVKKYTVMQQGFKAEEKARLHPTQKPVILFKQIIKDYSKEGDLIGDCFIGSGTTAIASKLLNRNFIGCDNQQKYVDITNKRLNAGW
jgi:site-specific DNA-methyltransferase (adenine-specific)